MKAVVIKISKNKAFILKDDGSFSCVPDKGYKIGQEIWRKERNKQGFTIIAKVAAAAAAIFIMFFGAVYAYNTPAHYVSIDINPSFEFKVNVFNRVIGANGADKDGAAVLEKVEITNKSMEDAIEIVIRQAGADGYINSASERNIVVGVHCTSLKMEQEVMESARVKIEQSLDDMQVSTTVTLTSVQPETIVSAQDAGITAGKMELITDYLEKTSKSEEKIEELLDVPAGVIAEEIKEIEEQSKNNNGKNENASKPEASSNSEKSSPPKSSNDQSEKDKEKDKDNNGKNNKDKETPKDKTIDD
ncbi:MAG: anti-sigma factor domain-containing protein [Clostridia bacterium]|nr:anti-sigma factor domain-containing protein [Clostridia bacterium]